MSRAAAKLQAVLFDLDGTLVDSAPGLGAAVDQMRVARQLESLPSECYRPVAGAGARGLLGVAFGVAPGEAQFSELREEFFRNYEARMIDETSVFDGVPELIAELIRRSLPWGVVTNKAMRFTGPLTQAIPLFSSAGVIVGGDSTPHAKPHPAPLLEAARRLAVDAACCVYVGDDQRDIVAGRAAGMRTIAATYGYMGADADVTMWQADATIARPADLISCLETLGFGLT
ncbi:MAG: HAD-IA family hydrolase [Variovorax sp.]